MNTERLLAFSDGVLAIIITIMVLEIKIPHGETLSLLIPLIPRFFTYLLSFIYIGSYWNNHCYLLNSAQKITGKVIWANLCLLFWLSLLPFATGWMGENHFTDTPTAFYGVILLMAELSYSMLVYTLLLNKENDAVMTKANTQYSKAVISIALYLIAIPVAYYSVWTAQIIYVVVALIWFNPARRIKKK